MLMQEVFPFFAFYSTSSNLSCVPSAYLQEEKCVMFSFEKVQVQVHYNCYIFSNKV